MPRRKTKKKKATQSRYHDRPFSKLERQLRSNYKTNNVQRESP